MVNKDTEIHDNPCLLPMPCAPLAVRLPTWLDQEVRQDFARLREGPSAGLRRIVEEWWTLDHFSHLEFRQGPTGKRRAAIRGGPEVATIVAAWREVGEDRQRFRERFPDLSWEVLSQARDYYFRFGEKVDGEVEEDARLRQYIPFRRQGSRRPSYPDAASSRSELSAQ